MLRLNAKNVSSICKIGKKAKGIPASFAVIPQTEKITATACGKCLVKIEKALNLYNILRQTTFI